MINTLIGRHINIRHGFLTAPAHAKNIGCDIFQIFLGAPQQILTKKKALDDLIKFGKELEKIDMWMVVHGSYTINLCHPIKSERFKDSVKSLVQDLESIASIGNRCIGVIIHMGKNIQDNNISTKAAINNYVKGLESALKSTPKSSVIILETGASQGSEVCSSIEGLAEIYNSIDTNLRHRIKFCIDTCHIWATGYDISRQSSINDFFNMFKEKIGIDKIACFHLNDSKTALNSHVDRHADLGYGFIGDTGLKHIVRFANKYNIPIIMETPLDSVNELTNKDITFEEELNKVINWIKNIK